ncbi:MAG TPA: polymorphic toxin-type HINT domain-containing protein [Ktedonobacteraceae bacterium]|nr:polymorphic toxin-type HINT domain-containing protein [Ktedonobacteraceae bacterium]
MNLIYKAPYPPALVSQVNALIESRAWTTTTPVTASHAGKASSSQKGEVLHTNERHPFLTQEQGFLPVSQLKAGMHILRADGSVGVVSNITVVPGSQVMYNLTVAHDHTYVVGTGQWIVHNTNCGNFAQAAVDWLKSPAGANKLNHIFYNNEHDHLWDLTGLDQEGNLGLIRQVIEYNYDDILAAAKSGLRFSKDFGSFRVTIKGFLNATGVFQVNTAYVNLLP